MNQTIDDRQSRLSRSLFFSEPIHRRTRNAGRAAPLRCRVPRPIRKDNNVNYAPTLTPPVELSWLLKIFPNSSIGVVSALKLFRTNQRTLMFQPRAMPRAKGRRKGATGSQLEQGRPNSVTLGTALQVVVWGGGGSEAIRWTTRQVDYRVNLEAVGARKLGRWTRHRRRRRRSVSSAKWWPAIPRSWTLRPTCNPQLRHVLRSVPQNNTLLPRGGRTRSGSFTQKVCRRKFGIDV